jgi:hypothetical protein
MSDMTTLARLRSTAASWKSSVLGSGGVFCRDVGHGLLEIGHNSLALLGLAVIGILVLAGGRADLRHALEAHTLSWLQARHEARQPAPAVETVDFSEPDAIARATAADPRHLTRAQAAVAGWLSRRYRVAPEPVSRLVQEAWRVGEAAKLDPTLILAVMAVESSFNPFAQSPVGAQGLMQVMTKIHDDKYEAFGGSHAAFDPVTNLRVGVLVLKECIARAGSLEAGLRYYVGAANIDDGGYVMKVLVEQNILRQLAGEKPLPLPTRRPAAVVEVVEKDAPGVVAPPVGTDPMPHPAAAPADLPEKIALLR